MARMGRSPASASSSSPASAPARIACHAAGRAGRRRAPRRPPRRRTGLGAGRRAQPQPAQCARRPQEPAGRDVVLALVERADVLVEGLRPGVTERLGLGPDACLARNPRLVYGRMTGWGQDGPLAADGRTRHQLRRDHRRPARDRPGGQARCRPSTWWPTSAAARMFLVVGVLAALLERARSGAGPGRRRRHGRRRRVAGHHGLHDARRRACGRPRRSQPARRRRAVLRHLPVRRRPHVAVGALEPQFYAELVDAARADRQLQPARQTGPGHLAGPARRRSPRAFADPYPRRVGRALRRHRRLRRAGARPDRGAVRTRTWPRAARSSSVDGVVQPRAAPRFSRTPGPRRRPAGHTDSLAGVGLPAWRYQLLIAGDFGASGDEVLSPAATVSRSSRSTGREARNALNACGRARASPRPSTSWTAPTSCGSGCSPAPVAPSLPAWISRRSSRARARSIEGRGLCGITAGPAAQAAHRRGRGLGAGRRVRADAGLRPGRGGARPRGSACPRSSVRWSPRPARRFCCPSGCPSPSRWSCSSPASRSRPRAPTRSGLINRVVDEGKRLDAALELAATIAANGPLAVAATKQIARSTADWTADEAWAEQGRIVEPVFKSDDAREGATAFAEKRPPVWKGR